MAEKVVLWGKKMAGLHGFEMSACWSSLYGAGVFVGPWNTSE
jgi:hypothetical protein